MRSLFSTGSLRVSVRNRGLKVIFNFKSMKKVYLDNASTTAIRAEVIQEMSKVMTEEYGNPSSTHSLGRAAKIYWNFLENR
jgi:selenocysteine lyase/cysteine desulfurase